jgi:hypothetical protein
MAGQMALGFILPFALAFVAIPLEVFIRSGRTVLGSAVAILLGSLAFALRLGGLFFRQVAEVLVGLYDAIVALPLVIEGAFRNRPGRDRDRSENRTEDADPREAVARSERGTDRARNDRARDDRATDAWPKIPSGVGAAAGTAPGAGEGA